MWVVFESPNLFHNVCLYTQAHIDMSNRLLDPHM